MTKSALIKVPNPLLHQKSQRIGHVDDQIKKLAKQMIKTTLDWERSRANEFGAALAAVQIGQPYRLVVIRNNFEDKKDKTFTVFVNPEIVKTGGKLVEDVEGCLSVASIYGSVPRYSKVKVKALDLNGQPFRVTAEGFLARVFQHEIDHTNGVVFLDRVKDPSKLMRLEPDGSFSQLAPAGHE